MDEDELGIAKEDGMIKVLVVIYGLVLFVPTGDVSDNVTDELRAVFVRADYDVGGEHTPIVRSVAGSGDLGDPWVLPAHGDFAITFHHARGSGITIESRSQFAHLDPGTAGPVQDECLLPRNSSTAGQCAGTADHDLTHGIAAFTGEWTTRAASYCCGFRLPIGMHDFVKYQFLKRDEYPDSHDPGQPMATALVIETLADPNDLAVRVNGSEQSLHLLTHESCRRWTGDGAYRCVVVVMGNPPTSNDSCRGSACLRDHHFGGFYALARHRLGPADRRFPYVVSDDVSCPCPDVDSIEPCLELVGHSTGTTVVPGELFNWPSVRCPPTFATPE